MNGPDDPVTGNETTGPDEADLQHVFAGLLDRARSGDERAIAQLIEPYRKYLLMIANQGMDDAWRAKMGASDIVQETMLKAQQNLDQFEGEQSAEFKAWLAAILTNDVRKTHRQFRTQKRNARQEINIQDQSAVGRGLTDRQMTPGTNAVRQEKERALHEAMNRLTPDQRRVIELRSFDGLSFEEVGRAIEKNADAARKFWARSVAALADQLRQQAPDLLTGNIESRRQDDE